MSKRDYEKELDALETLRKMDVITEEEYGLQALKIKESRDAEAQANANAMASQEKESDPTPVPTPSQTVGGSIHPEHPRSGSSIKWIGGILLVIIIIAALNNRDARKPAAPIRFDERLQSMSVQQMARAGERASSVQMNKMVNRLLEQHADPAAKRLLTTWFLDGRLPEQQDISSIESQIASWVQDDSGVGKLIREQLKSSNAQTLPALAARLKTCCSQLVAAEEKNTTDLIVSSFANGSVGVLGTNLTKAKAYGVSDAVLAKRLEAKVENVQSSSAICNLTAFLSKQSEPIQDLTIKLYSSARQKCLGKTSTAMERNAFLTAYSQMGDASWRKRFSNLSQQTQKADSAKKALVSAESELSRSRSAAETAKSTLSSLKSDLKYEKGRSDVFKLRGWVFVPDINGLYEVSRGRQKLALSTVRTAFYSSGTFSMWVRRSGYETIHLINGGVDTWPRVVEYTEIQRLKDAISSQKRTVRSTKSTLSRAKKQVSKKKKSHKSAAKKRDKLMASIPSRLKEK